jgi:uncharacterized protein
VPDLDQHHDLAQHPDLAAPAVGFAHTLRAAGVDATPDRVHAFLEALATLSATRPRDVYWAGRLTLCAGPDDLDRYDRVFGAYFSGVAAHARTTARRDVRIGPRSVGEQVGGAAEDDGDEVVGRAVTRRASALERLRHRDVADLTVAERAELARLLAAWSLPGEGRRSRRHRRSHAGGVDPHRTVRRMLAAGGEATPLARRNQRRRPRRVVLLVDVSGSMSAYADVLLRFAHAARRGRDAPTEVFTLGTRLTRITDELGHRDADTAMRALSAAVPDWSGGTRLGETLRDFLDRWGQRGVARGAVVVVLSDGWETGDVEVLAEQTARLGRLAHRVVWANPRAGRAGFAPTAGGMAAALPHVDELVQGHSLAALEHLAAVVAGHRDRSGAHA